MKILIAPNSFKESLTAQEVAEAIFLGFSQQYPEAEYKLLPLADGGEGTLNVLCNNLNDSLHTVTVFDPNNNEISAQYGILADNKTAIIESAEILGLALIAEGQRNAWLASSYGLGQLVLDALDKGCQKIIIALGGTSTCDGGMGALTALGARFLNKSHQPVSSGAKGLLELASIDMEHLDPRLKNTEIILAYDVSNLWLGEKGALLYVLQKGAIPLQLPEFNQAFINYASVLNTGLNTVLTGTPGTGAAGGMALAFLAFTNATLEQGSSMVLRHLDVQHSLDDTDLIISGEGQIDEQSLYGKTLVALAKLAHKKNIPIIALAGNLGPHYEKVYECGVSAVFSIAPGPITYDHSVQQASSLLVATANQIARLLRLGSYL